MRINTLKRKLAAGQRVCGVLLEFSSPELLELFGFLGYDFVFIDGQHGGVNADLARGLIRAADASGLSTLVRVPRNDPPAILEFLDASAGGIIVPNITTPEECEAAAAAMRYPPIGIRGGFGRSRAANYGVTQSAVEYFTKMNDELIFAPLIEDESALPNLAEIMAVPGVDLVVIGPGDLALSMGIPGGWQHPRVQEGIQRIRAAADAAGKPTLLLALDADDARQLYASGCQAVQVSAASLIAGAAKGFLESAGRD